MPVTWPVTGIRLAAGLPASDPACAFKSNDELAVVGSWLPADS